MAYPAAPRRFPCALRPSVVPSRGLLLALACAGLGSNLWAQAPSPSVNTTAATAATRSYQIPAGTLEDALNRFGRDSGLLLSFTQDQVQGLRSPGLQGSHTAQAGLAALLQGTGLEAAVQPQGGYVLRQRAVPDARAPDVAPRAVSLAEVRVAARRAGDGTTEGTGSYTSRVTSIASKTDQSFREIAQSVSVVTREQLDNQHLVNVNEALALTPGITVNRANFSTFDFYARGFQITSMQIDGGAPLALGSYTYEPQQDMAFYDRVEVMRGASGLLGGAGDPGGIVNLARKKPLAERRFTLEQSVGRWDSSRTMLDATGSLGLDGRLRGRVVAVYENRNYHLRDRSLEKPALYGVLEMDLTPDSLLTVGGSYGKRHENGYGDGMPRYSDGRPLNLARSASLTQPWAFWDTESKELFAQLAHRFSNGWKLKANLTHVLARSKAATAFVDGAIDPLTGTGAYWGGGRYDTSSQQDIVDVSLSGTFGLLGRRHEFVAGMDWQRAQGTWATGKPSDNWAVPADVFSGNPWNPDMNVPLTSIFDPWNQEQKGAYGMLRLHPTDRLHAIVGARASRYDFLQGISSADAAGHLSLTSRTAFGEPTKVTPYGGVIYDLDSQWSVYASYASIFKPQALLKAGPLPGSSLAPIKGKSLEAGFKGELLDGKLNATFSVFSVERTGTGVVDERYPTNRDPWAGNCCYLPQGKVTSRGFDAEIGGELRPGWQLAAGYTFNQTRDRSAQGSYSTITPRHLLKLSTAYQLPGAWSQWLIGGSAHVQSRTSVKGSLYDADFNATPYSFNQGGYAVLNAMAQYRIDPRWTVALNINNLLDKVYYERVGTASGGNWYGTPRNVVLTLRGSF
ncbi:TonB-dependent siderophore receptor [Delftia acidovorans]